MTAPFSRTVLRHLMSTLDALKENNSFELLYKGVSGLIKSVLTAFSA